MSMGDNGPFYKFQKPGFSSQGLGPLKCLKDQWIIKEKIIVVPRVGDV
jgi:hypothetical protein